MRACGDKAHGESGHSRAIGRQSKSIVNVASAHKVSKD